MLKCFRSGHIQFYTKHYKSLLLLLLLLLLLTCILGKHEYQHRKCSEALFDLSAILEYAATGKK